MLILALLLAATSCIGAEDAAVRVVIDVDTPLRATAHAFLGLSLEKEQLTCGRLRPDNRPLVGMMRLLGHGTLRLGGNSVDVTGPGTLSKVDDMLQLARVAGWQVIYGLNLGVDDPRAAAREAREVWAHGRDVVLAFEVGNEPDLYEMQRLRPSRWSVARYLEQFAQYRKLLADLPLSGPGIGNIYDGKRWFVPFIDEQGAGLAFASVHFYPMVARTPLPPHSPALPTLEHMLSPHIADALAARLLAPLIEAARRKGLPFRVTESNTAARSGQPGVSDTFASALWIIDWSLRLQILGADGIDVQGDLLNPHDLYTPLLEENGVLRARPMYYGMLLLGQLHTGTLVATTVDAAAPHIRAYAVAARDGLQIVLVNTDARVASVRLTAPGASGTVMRLSASSLVSRDGVTLGGRAVQPDGSWTPAAREPLQRDEDGGWRVAMPGGSAALLELTAPRHAAPLRFAWARSPSREPSHQEPAPSPGPLEIAPDSSCAVPTRGRLRTAVEICKQDDEPADTHPRGRVQEETRRVVRR